MKIDPNLKNKEWRMSHLYKIRDKDQKLITFKLNKAQADFEKNRHTRNLILKSRQLGFTTLEAIGTLDDTLFNANTECLFIAHNLDDAKSIFRKKIRFEWENFPRDLQGLWEVDASNAQELKFSYGDGSFSSIAVDTSGRSGTYNRVHITEFADLSKKYPHKVLDILEGTIPAVPRKGRVDIESTSQGASGEFYDMYMKAYEFGEPVSPMQYKAHFYNWQWDPLIETMVFKDNLPKEFMEYQKEFALTDKEITYYHEAWLSLNKNWNSLRKEYPTTVEEAFEVIIEGSYYGVELGKMDREGRIGIVPHDKALKVHTSWDLGVGLNLVVGFYQRTREGQLRRIDSWQGAEGDGLPEAVSAVLAKDYVYGYHFGPHDLETKDIGTGKTRMEAAKKLGIKFRLVPDVGVDDGINAAHITLSTMFVDKEKNLEWIRAMRNYIREWDDKRGAYKDIPFHNWASHFADEFRYASLVADKMTNDTMVRVRPIYDEMEDIWKGRPTRTIERYEGQGEVGGRRI